jgi:hypothetical protein
MRVRGRGHPSRGEGEAGFAALDALVALTVVGLLCALSVQAASMSSRATRMAHWRAAAIAEIDLRLATAWPRLNGAGTLSGGPDASGGAWRVEAHELARTQGAAGLCRVSAEVRPRGAARSFRVETLRVCGGGAAS